MATFVLIPGAGGDPWEWHLLVPELEALGHDVVAVTAPGGRRPTPAGPSTPTPSSTAIGDRTRPSSSSPSPSPASPRRSSASGVPVDLLVLLNAMIPMPGETGNAWWSNTRRKEAEQAYFAEVGLPPETADDELAVYFHDVPPDVVAEAADPRAGADDDADGAAVAARRAGRTSRRGSSRDATTGSSRSRSSGGWRGSGSASRPTRSTAGTWSRSAILAELARRLEAYRAEADASDRRA